MSDTKELVLGVSVGAAIIIIAFFSLSGTDVVVSSASKPPEDVHQYANVTKPQALTTNAPAETVRETINQTRQATTLHYNYEQKIEPLLDERILLFEGGSRLFSIDIPNKNVTTLSGEITSEGKGFVLASVEDKSGKLYCDGCSVEVFGAQSNASSWNKIGIVNIGVSGGESMNLKILNPKSSEFVTVHVKLKITYEEPVVDKVDENK